MKTRKQLRQAMFTTLSEVYFNDRQYTYSWYAMFYAMYPGIVEFEVKCRFR